MSHPDEDELQDLPECDWAGISEGTHVRVRAFTKPGAHPTLASEELCVVTDVRRTSVVVGEINNIQRTRCVTDPAFLEVLSTNHTRGGAHDDGERCLRSKVREHSEHALELDELNRTIDALTDELDDAHSDAQAKLRSSKAEYNAKVQRVRTQLTDRLERHKKAHGIVTDNLAHDARKLEERLNQATAEAAQVEKDHKATEVRLRLVRRGCVFMWH